MTTNFIFFSAEEKSKNRYSKPDNIEQVFTLGIEGFSLLTLGGQKKRHYRSILKSPVNSVSSISNRAPIRSQIESIECFYNVL